jgi:serine/threonine-protein kinase
MWMKFAKTQTTFTEKEIRMIDNTDKAPIRPEFQKEPCDPVEALVPKELADLLFPLPDDAELESADEELTEEDHLALDKLGGPIELLARIRNRKKRPPAVRPPEERTTCMNLPDTTSTQRNTEPTTPAKSHEFRDLLQRLNACEQLDLLSWTCDYRKTKVIGRGGQGTVYLTECLNEHNLPKALKFFSPEPYGHPNAYEEDMERMAHVALLVSRILIDNLVIIEQFSSHDGIYFVIMRWIDGRDLASLIDPGLLNQLHDRLAEKNWEHLINVVDNRSGGNRLSLMPGMAVNIIEKCLRALDALHSQGIVHGDIKPSNIMLDRYGSIRLVDLGSAFEVSARPQRHTWTPLYAPPEIFEGGKWTPQSDLASLGYVLIEMLGGRPAVTSPGIGSDSTRDNGTGWNRSLLEQKRSLPDRLDDLLPANVRAAGDLMKTLRRLVHPDPNKRFLDAEDALIGPDGTYQFMQGLARMRLAAPFSQKIKLWLADVDTVLGEETKRRS